MPAYITAADLLATGATRLAQAATPDDRPVLSSDLLRVAIAGEALDGYALDPEQLNALAEAQTHIDAAIARAEGDLDAACRGRYALPISPLDAATRGLLLDLALAYVHRQGRPKDVEEARAAAESRLLRIARGDLVLAAAAESAAVTVGEPEWSAADPVLDPDGAGW